MTGLARGTWLRGQILLLWGQAVLQSWVGLVLRQEARPSGQWVWVLPQWQAASALCSRIRSGCPGDGGGAAGTGHQEAFLPWNGLERSWWAVTQLLAHAWWRAWDWRGLVPGVSVWGQHGFDEPTPSFLRSHVLF